MALAFGAIVYDGLRTKIFTVTYLDNDAPADLTVQFAIVGMTNFQGTVSGLEYEIVKTASAADTAGELTVKSCSNSAVTVRKTTPAGAMGADAKTFRVRLSYPSGINA